MNRTEFLNALQAKLKEELSDAQVNEQFRYYNSYISQEAVNGKTEEEVIEMLGDPLLLARTILESPGRTSSAGSYSDTTDNSIYSKPEQNQNSRSNFNFKTSSSWGCLMVAIVAIFAIFAILWLVGVIANAILPVLVPIIIIMIVVTMLKKGK